MRDEIYDRDYQAGRAELHSGIDRLIASTAAAFRKLAEIQFAAPWRDGLPAKVAKPGSGRHMLLVLVGVALASGASVATALAPFAFA